ncbi:hypothetical protein [Mesorhizobium sp. M1027]|uniref:hypothetical protein n=1 Tax=Mesorhizobium sp. M1027 TaxID=2957050 RepID=UPI003334B152
MFMRAHCGKANACVGNDVGENSINVAVVNELTVAAIIHLRQIEVGMVHLHRLLVYLEARVERLAEHGVDETVNGYNELERLINRLFHRGARHNYRR